MSVVAKPAVIFPHGWPRPRKRMPYFLAQLTD